MEGKKTICGIAVSDDAVYGNYEEKFFGISTGSDSFYFPLNHISSVRYGHRRFGLYALLAALIAAVLFWSGDNGLVVLGFVSALIAYFLWKGGTYELRIRTSGGDTKTISNSDAETLFDEIKSRLKTKNLC